ncbi:MAG: ATP-binding cassette domain-containing protein [Acidimicrobiales bacterium]|nr:ATP-binding cassette domain-containing protein [Acidimicrobiales bacterium]
MDPTVRLTDVSRRYGRAVVLDGLSFELRQGIVALLGPNGAGKTTLLKLLSTALSPDDGEITVLGRRADGPLADRIEIRRRLGFLPQEVEFPSSMTAFSFLDYIAVLKEWDDRRARHDEVRRVLQVVGLDDRPTIKVRKLSGGQRRRLAFAQALLGRPELLVLDEPTTGLDPEQRATFRATLSGLGRAATVVLATHQTEDVAAVCDRVLVLAAGRIVFDGDVAAFVGTAQGRVSLHERTAPGAVASWRDPGGRVRSVGGTPAAGAEAAAPTVEDAYLLLVGPGALRGGA